MMRKLMLGIVLTAMMLFVLPAMTVRAEIVDSGECGEDATWTLDDEGTLIISGSGAIKDYEAYSEEESPFQSKIIQNVIIEDGITRVGTYAFYEQENLKNITFPDSLLSIGQYAFCSSEALNSLILPEQLTTIEEGAFMFCGALKSVVFAESLISIGEGAFSYCHSLKSIVFPASLQTIGKRAFAACWNLDNVFFPEGLEEIGEGAFSTCKSITEISIPSSVRMIDPSAFRGPGKLTRITIAQNNTVYDSRNNCNAIIETSTNKLLFGCQNTQIPEGIVSIGDQAFEFCGGPTMYGDDELVDGWRNNEYELFDLIIPNSVTSIGSAAFRFSNLRSIVISSNVTQLDWKMFEATPYLQSIVINDGNLMYDSRDNCNAIIETASNTMIAGCKKTIIPNDITEIGPYAMAYRDMEELTLPNTVTRIDEAAFFSCIHLKEATIPDSVTYLGDNAFQRCDSLEQITLSNNLTRIGWTAFWGCESLKEIIVPDSVTYLGDEAFYGCNSLERITLSRNLGTIEYYCFARSIVSELIIPEGIETLETGSFSDCARLETVYIPKSIRIIRSGAFERCNSIKDVYYAGTEDEWNSIYIYNSNNSNSLLLSATIHYNSSGPKTGFDLKKDGHCISNSHRGFSYGKWYNLYGLLGYGISLERYQEVFGKSYTKQVYNQNISTWRGNCYGMAVTAAMFYLERLPVKDYTHGEDALTVGGYDSLGTASGKSYLSLKETSKLTKLIERYQIWQESNEYCEAIEKFYEDNPNWIYDYKAFQEIIDSLTKTKEPYLISIFWDDDDAEDTIKKEGHEVVLDSSRKPEELGDGWYRVYIYDPNNPYYGGFGDATPADCYLQAENRYIDLNINNGKWRMSATINSDGSSKKTIGYDEDGNYISGSDIWFMSAKDIPSSFSKKATFTQSTGKTSVSFASDDFTVFDANKKMIYQMTSGQVTFIENDTVEEHYSIGYLEDAEEGVSTGRLILPEGEYTVEINSGYVAYSSNDDYAGIVVTEPTVVKNTTSTSLEIQSESNELVNVVIEDTTDEEFISVSTDVIAKDDTCAVSIEEDKLTIDSNTNQTVNIEILTEEQEKTITDVEVNGESEATINLPEVLETLPVDITDAEIAEIPAQTYTGKALTPVPTVTIDGYELVKDVDVEISYQDNINAGTAKVIITGIGNYTGTIEKTFTIQPAGQVIKATAKAAAIAVGKTTAITTTGAKGKVTYKSSDTAVATVSTVGKVTAKKVGTVKITVTAAATENYKKATKTVTIKVVPAATSSVTTENLSDGIKVTWKKVTGATGYYVYRDGKQVKKITSGTTLTYKDTGAKSNGTKYTYKVVAYAGTGTSTLSKEVTTCYTKRPAISSVKAGTKQFTVTWGKNAKASGYQIQYSTTSGFTKNNKTVTVTSASTVKKIVKSLTKGKTYYVRVRAYKTLSGEKIYSAWSAKKSVKVK